MKRSDLYCNCLSRIRTGRRKIVADSLIFYITKTEVSPWEIGRLFGVRPAYITLWRKLLADSPVDDLEVANLESTVLVEVNSSKAV